MLVILYSTAYTGKFASTPKAADSFMKSILSTPVIVISGTTFMETETTTPATSFPSSSRNKRARVFSPLSSGDGEYERDVASAAAFLITSPLAVPFSRSMSLISEVLVLMVSPAAMPISNGPVSSSPWDREVISAS